MSITVHTEVAFDLAVDRLQGVNPHVQNAARIYEAKVWGNGPDVHNGIAIEKVGNGIEFQVFQPLSDVDVTITPPTNVPSRDPRFTQSEQRFLNELTSRNLYAGFEAYDLINGAFSNNQQPAQ